MHSLLKLGAAIVAPLVLSACGIDKEQAELEEAVKAEILAQLKDPNSAEFRNVVVAGNIVCGEVNAKNGFGGYVGFKSFWGSRNEGGETWVSVSEDSGGSAMCAYKDNP